MVLPHRTGALGDLGSQTGHQGRLGIPRVWTLPEGGGRGRRCACLTLCRHWNSWPRMREPMVRGVCLGIGQAGTVVVEQCPRGQGTAVPGGGGRALQLLLCCLCAPWSRGLWPSSSGSPPWAGRGNTRAQGACYLSLQEDPRTESRATPSCQGQGQEVRVLRGQARSYAFLYWGRRDTSAGRRRCHTDRQAVTDAQQEADTSSVSCW